MPITGTFAGHPLSTPTALGALLAAGRQHHFHVALQWFDCCGFFVNSIAGVPGDATHFWAFKVGHTLSSIGAGSVPATAGLNVLYYYTTFNPTTGATEPTLGLDGAKTVSRGGTVTFNVRSWNDAGKSRAAGGALVSIGGIAVRSDSTGHLTVQFSQGRHLPGAGDACRDDPVAHAMGARSRLGLVLTAPVVAGCGSGVATPPSGPRAAIVTITRGFGQKTLTTAPRCARPVGARRPPPQRPRVDQLRRPLRAGDRRAGGRPVAGMAWLYFVNGIQANVGSADYTLHPGDHEWWDYRYWNDLIQVPVAIGAWPEPFVHGYGGKRPQVQVTGPSCAARLTTALRGPAPMSSAGPRHSRCGSRRFRTRRPRCRRASGRVAA